jgi:predicted RNA-binding Zn-ribbon protein involved in translation (DUF1610 family)
MSRSYRDHDYIADYDGSPLEFQSPGSALRRATRTNPRNKPCPTCGEPNRLTRKDQIAGYQCDSCAFRAENGIDY